tara:strand:+ start:755 stop:1264 length:510 start_codon:yes stop_codon:yes gene_type:complete
MPAEGLPLAEDILRFWFEECKPWQWFRSDLDFDRSVSERFRPLVEAAQEQGLIDWEVSQTSSLALVLLLDQFSRQIWRDQARAFQGDLRAQRLSHLALDQHWLEHEPQKARRQFWLMPLLHAERLETVNKAIPLLERWVDISTADVARRNRDMLIKHGRYPWRDGALGR